jgi:oligopeptide/dipeptide ABC transporter ATP-binding protein
MRQRVMIAMALSCEPKLLIADEPTTALDVTIQAQILELVKDLQKDLGMAVILITHDLGVVAESADDVLVMYAGKVAERAVVQSLFKSPKHPYTQGLMASLPRPRTVGERGRRTERLTGISGSVPSFANLPLGCRFQDRCRKVVPHCREAEPPLEIKEPNHWASCFEV